MEHYNNNNATPKKDTGSKNTASERDNSYDRSSEITNPLPSTATPSIPSEMPAQEGK